MIRLIAIDIDGTLLDSQWRVPRANRDAIAEAIATGIEVALVTGRRFDFALPVIDALPEPLTLMVNNGVVIKARDGRTMLSHLLPRGVARRVLESTRAYRETAAVVFDRPRAEQVIFECIDWSDRRRSGYAERNRPFIAEVVPLEACLTEDPIQLMFNGPCTLMRRLVAELRALPFARDFAVSVTEYENRDFAMVDVVQAGRSKGSALADWAERRGFARSEVMAIGDNLNDREMLEAAGCAVVMGNAVDELKALGWPLTGTNDEAGVAAAIRRYALGP